MRAIIFSSKGNSAKKVAVHIRNEINENSFIVNISDDFRLVETLEFNQLVLISPTYGDEELEETMEKFLIESNWDSHKGKDLFICELGLYRGYEITKQGAGQLIKSYLTQKELIPRGEIMSIDSLPLENYELINTWIQKNLINE